MNKSSDMAQLPALLRHVPYTDNAGNLTELDCYLYTGIPNMAEQMVAHLGIVTVKDGAFVIPGATYIKQEEAINALFTRWQKGEKR